MDADLGHGHGQRHGQVKQTLYIKPKKIESMEIKKIEALSINCLRKIDS
jgi:hypothetical protein